MAGSMMFPNTGLRVLSALIHLIGLSILTHCLSRQFFLENLTSWASFKALTPPRVIILLIFMDSWAFLFSSAIAVFGVGMEHNKATCNVGIILCVAFYITSKLLIYAFFAERIHIVWQPVHIRPRFKSPPYLVAFGSLIAYLAVIVVVFVGRVARFREDGRCGIGLRLYASISLLAFDLYINVFLTGMFLWPLYRSKSQSAAVKRVTSRTLIAAFVALSTSAINLVVLTVMHGQQLGWVCLGSCGSDVIVNTLVLFWVTGSSNAGTSSSSAQNKIVQSSQNKSEEKRADSPPGSSEAGEPMRDKRFDYVPVL